MTLIETTSEIRGGKATFAWGMKHCLSMYTTKWFNFKEHFEYVKLNWIDIVHSTPMSIGLVHMVVSKTEYFIPSLEIRSWIGA